MKFSLNTKLFGISAFLILIGFVVGIAGLVGIRQTNKGLETVYNDRVVPLRQLGAISDAYGISIIDATNKTNAGIYTAEQARQSIQSAQGVIKENWKAYMSTTLTTEEAKLAAEADRLYGPADTAVDKLSQFLDGKSGSLAGKLDDYDGPLYQYVDPITGKIGELSDLQMRVAGEEYQSAQARYHTLIVVCTTMMLFGLIVGCALVWSVIRGLSRSLTTAISLINEGSEQVSSAATQVSSASQSLAEGASEQAASLEETSSSLEEMASMTSQNAKGAQDAKSVADSMRAAADSSAEQMKQMQQAMDAIKESSAGISQILKTIDEIAFQTNILALNAAVEAARAGEAGAGFAVVAEEVRNLAQRSAQSAKETSIKIEAAIQNSDNGVAISGKVADSLNQIVEKARSMDQLVAEIANASGEQDKGIGQLTTAVQQMDKVTQSNASSAEETASAAEELNANAASLKDAVGHLAGIIDGRDRRDSDRTPEAGFGIKPRTGVSVDAGRRGGAVRARTLNASVRSEGGQHFLPQTVESSGSGKSRA